MHGPVEDGSGGGAECCTTASKVPRRTAARMRGQQDWRVSNLIDTLNCTRAEREGATMESFRTKLVPNVAIIPTGESQLYPEPGVDLIVSDGEGRWEHIEWLRAPKDEGWGWSWESQLDAAGYWAFRGDVTPGTSEYDTVSIEPKDEGGK